MECSDDSDSDVPGLLIARERENVRCTYRVRRDPPNRQPILTPSQMRERMEMKRMESKREEYSFWRSRNDSDEEYSPSYQGRESPPLVSSFKRTERRSMPINQLLDKPWRDRRPDKIIIFIRGPLCSGKAYLAKCILDKEASYGNDKGRKINGIKLLRRRNEMDRDGPEFLLKEFEEAIKEQVKFLIVEMKSRKRQVMDRCLHLARIHDYSMYGIDINVDLESRSYRAKLKETRWYAFESMTKGYVMEMRSNSMPYFVTMLNPLGVLPSTYKIKNFLDYADDFFKPAVYTQPESCEEDFSTVNDAIYNISVSKDIFEHFPDGIKINDSFENELVEKVGDYIISLSQFPKKSVVELHLMKFPSCDPAKTIEYDHKKKFIDDGKILEVNALKVLDYSHSTNQYLLSIIEDVDIEKAIEKRKADLRDKKFEYYKQFVDEAVVESIDDQEIYPKNWEIVEIDRPKVHGKRKKKKTAKILRVIQQKSVNNVQRGVKRLKIEEKAMLDSQDDDSAMDIDTEPEIPYYIDEISRKTSILNRSSEAAQDELELIKTFYIRLDSIPAMSSILHLVAQVDHLKIIFDLNEGENSCYSPKDDSIKIFVKDLPETDILRILGHQLMHCAVNWTYKNEAKPFAPKDEDRKDELERIFFEIETTENEKQQKFKKILEMLNESNTNYIEFIGIYGEMIVDGATDELQNVASLKKFLDRMMSDIENFGKRFIKGTTLGVF